MFSAALLLCTDKDLEASFFFKVFNKQLLDFYMYVSVLAGLSFAFMYSVISVWYSKKLVSTLSWQDKFCLVSGRDQAQL